MSNSSEYFLQLLQRFLKNPNQVRQIHSLLITNGHFRHKPRTPILKWKRTLLYNTLIRAYLSFGEPSKSLSLFAQMLSNQATPNSHTFPSLVKSATISSPSLGKPIHAQVIERGVQNDLFIQTSLVNFYSEVGELSNACQVFEEIAKPCIVACNVMIDAFAKNGDMGSAVLLFERMFVRDVVSWTSIINGFLKNGCFVEAVQVFEIMMGNKVKPNEATYVSVLSSCANLDGGIALCRGKELHGYIVRNETDLTTFTGTALIDFYGKLGYLENANNVFNQINVQQVCTWNAMISSLACNGKEKEALVLFEKMKMEGMHPNEVTFVAVLTACSRGKLVELGLELFRSMSSQFEVVPIMEHYGCVVDLLGRAGLLWEATEFLRSMPLEPDASVLGALLGACRIYGAAELGSEVGKRLLMLQPWHSGRYVVLANIKAGEEKWDCAADTRKAMVTAGIPKIPAYSLIETRSAMCCL